MTKSNILCFSKYDGGTIWRDMPNFVSGHNLIRQAQFATLLCKTLVPPICETIGKRTKNGLRRKGIIQITGPEGRGTAADGDHSASIWRLPLTTSVQASSRL